MLGPTLRYSHPAIVIRFNPFPYPGISHGRPLARRGRPSAVEGPGWLPRRRSLALRLRPGELTIRNLVSKSDFLLFFRLLGDGGAASRRRSSRTSIRGIPNGQRPIALSPRLSTPFRCCHGPMRSCESVSDAGWSQLSASEHMSRTVRRLVELNQKCREPRRGGCGNGDRARCGRDRVLGFTARAVPVDRPPLLTGRAERESWISGILSQGAVSRSAIAQTARIR